MPESYFKAETVTLDRLYLELVDRALPKIRTPIRRICEALASAPYTSRSTCRRFFSRPLRVGMCAVHRSARLTGLPVSRSPEVDDTGRAGGGKRADADDAQRGKVSGLRETRWERRGMNARTARATATSVGWPPRAPG